MKCKILELGERDAWWPERSLFVGLVGEMMEDDLMEYDADTGWASGYFDFDEDLGITTPVFFSEVKIKEI